MKRKLRPLTADEVWEAIEAAIESVNGKARFSRNPPKPSICKAMVSNCPCGGNCGTDE